MLISPYTHTLSHINLNILNWVQHLLDIKTKTKLAATASNLKKDQNL